MFAIAHIAAPWAALELSLRDGGPAVWRGLLRGSVSAGRDGSFDGRCWGFCFRPDGSCPPGWTFRLAHGSSPTAHCFRQEYPPHDSTTFISKVTWMVFLYSALTPQYLSWDKLTAFSSFSLGRFFSRKLKDHVHFFVMFWVDEQ